ncbi:MAG: hypothetical protein IKV15_01010 [Bacteroidaceae bacterium]|nr:hypothetical protein [Bacteroidaceae bacterium]
MGNNKQDKGFKIAVLAIMVVFATLFYIEYVRSNRYIAIPHGDALGWVFDTQEEMYVRPYNGNVKNYNK